MFILKKLLCEVFCILVIAESSTVENGKVNGHVNGSAGGSPAENEVEASADGTKRAFLSLKQDESGQAKASVVEVFKKVWCFNLKLLSYLNNSLSHKKKVFYIMFCVFSKKTITFSFSDLGDGILRDVRVHSHSVRLPSCHCRCQNNILSKMG